MVIGRATSIIRQQMAKTIRSPARIFYIPFNLARAYLAQLLVRFPVLTAPALSIIPAAWTATAGGKAFCNGLASTLFQIDHPGPAWSAMERSIKAGNVTTDEYLMGAMCLYHGLGRFRDAMILFDRANNENMAEAKRRGLDKLPYRVLDKVWARHIGHTATIDYVIKLGMQEGRAPENTILYVPRGAQIANRFLLDQVAQHIRLIEDPTDLPFGPDAVQALHYDYLGPRLPDGTTFYFSRLANATYKKWREGGGGHLFALPPEIEARGRAVLRGAGVPDDAWFVALHVREGKWDGKNGGMHGILNCDIKTYLPAIEEIVRRGGWVVRMGDAGMERLPPLLNVLDYCHSDLKADWMDIFVASRCRFMIGTSSGPAFVPKMYGVPTILTNWWPPAERAWHENDIFIPKMVRRISDGGYLALTDTLSEPYSWCHSRRYLADHADVSIEDNDPEIIRGAVDEMLSRLEGDAVENDVERLRIKADEIYAARDVSGSGLLARDFLRRYGDFVE